jgi:putative inorganic carbon (HCO3(-)) transporter
MRDTVLLWCDRIIRYGIYSLFFLVPLVFTNNTSELFELNKMWLTWEITLFIAGAWITKMILERRMYIQRTPLDIPILLFLLSHIISTIFSLDPHTSFWGYYSRFNGGLLSILTYIFLYYAIVTNLKKENILTILKVSLASGLVVALWGLPSHFGKDPTCLLFRGTLDVQCWTDAFKPTIRIFSTLGQPAWMAAYLNILLPLCMAMFLLMQPNKSPDQKLKSKNQTAKMSKEFYFMIGYFLLALLFYLDLIFTGTRAGIIAFWFANALFWGALFYKRYLSPRVLLRYFLIFNLLFLLFNFLFGTSFAQLDRFTLPSLTAKSDQTTVSTTSQPNTAPNPPAAPVGGTESGQIRQVVWQGAVDVWKANPLIGSGVETFAYSYFKHRPVAHNMTSEWDFLYNKAHNEYLNYLATTGIFGLGGYLAFIAFFLFITSKYLLTDTSRGKEWLLILALTTAFISILITNFFAFSVVIINMYLFLIPAFIFLLEPSLLTKKVFSLPKRHVEQTSRDISGFQWTGITAVTIMCLYFLLVLVRFWFADTAYALGSNLSRVQEYQQAYLKLGEAITLRSSEPVFKDEFAGNNAMIAALLLLQTDASPSAETKEQSRLLSEQAIALSNEVVQNHPNNITFWKNRVRLFYALAQADSRYLPYAVDAVAHVKSLAPTDAKVSYNLGALYRESGQPEKSAAVLEETIRLKPDYRDAYYALAVAYNDLAFNGSGQVVKPEYREKAIKQLRFILSNISPDDKQTQETLSSWNAL